MYEEQLMALADSRSYVQRLNFDNLTSSQKFTSCHELLQSAESTDEEVMECCNKVEAMTKEVNNIDAPERGDNNNKTIVEIIFKDFSTTPFNSPISSPERNLERSPLFKLRAKPKRYYSRKKNLNSKKSSNSILENLDYNVIEKKDTHNVSEGVVETWISENYNWDEDDNDLFLFINTQEILDQNNFPSTPKRGHKFPANKEITQGNQRNNKNLVLIESNVALGFQKARLREGKNEVEKVTNKMHQDKTQQKLHLKTLIKCKSDDLITLCKAAFDYLANGSEQQVAVYQLIAANYHHLNLKSEDVQHSVEALISLLIESAKINAEDTTVERPFQELGFSDKAVQILMQFVRSKRNFVEGSIKTANIRAYRLVNLEWRLEILLASRALMKQSQIFVTMKLYLHTEPKSENRDLLDNTSEQNAVVVHEDEKRNRKDVLVQIDLNSLKYMIQSLEEALTESRTRRVRNIIAAIH
uniref:COMM domain-containing protein n=1 Tax=Glossina pallidipes TaxID=7398 RepID=A0A1B0AD66_GLOPL